MTANDVIRQLQDTYNKLDAIRAEFVSNQANYIEQLERNGVPPLKALKDWQDTFRRILSAMDSCVFEMRRVVSGKET